jgi:hypothetical protein
MLAREQWWIGLRSAEQEPGAARRGGTRLPSKYSMYGIAHSADLWVESLGGECGETATGR